MAEQDGSDSFAQEALSMKPRRIHPLQGAALLYLSLSLYEPVWRLVVRGVSEGNQFAWAYGPLQGRGTGGDWWLLLLILVAGLTLLTLGWRRPNRLVPWLVTMWMAGLALQSTLLVIVAPDLRLEGETLGLSLPYGWVTLPFDLLFLGLSLWWAISGKGRAVGGRPGWGWLALAAALIPAAVALFRSGEQHGLPDQLGVATTFLQWILLNVGLYPWPDRRPAARAGAR
jgi:hypothetical protein